MLFFDEKMEKRKREKRNTKKILIETAPQSLL